MPLTIHSIKAAALQQFALKGYEAASLDKIAQEVGIKKQSLYSHFKSKNDLFLTVFAEAVARETAFADDYFERTSAGGSDGDRLYRFIEQFKSRYQEDLNLRLILYSGFMVPDQPAEQVEDAVTRYFEHLARKVRERILGDPSIAPGVPVDTAVFAYMNMLEGMLVELIYAGTTTFDARLQASWDVFWRGIR